MKLFLKSIFITITVLMSLSIQAQDQTKWTPKDIINTQFLRSVTFSNNAKMVVWRQRKAVKKKDKFISNLFLTRLDVKKDGDFLSIPLTQGDESNYNPLFAKDDESIYFLSSRDKGKKLWQISLYGGEAKAVATFKNGISNVQWQDKTTLLFTSNEGKTLRESELKKKKDNVIVVEDEAHWKPTRVYAYNLKTKETTRITNNKKPLSSYRVSPNGEWLVYTMQMSRHYPSDAQPDPHYFLKNLKTGQTVQVLKNLGFPSYGFQFTQDSQGFYFTTSKASDPEWNGAGIGLLYYFDLESKSIKKVKLKWAMGIGGGFDVVGNDVIVSLANKATRTLAYYKKGKTSWQKRPMDFGEKNNHISVLGVSKNTQKIAYGYSTASKLPTYFVADLQQNKFSNSQELVKLNKNLAKRSITKSEVMTWKGANNETVTGILYYPSNYQKGKRYPLILSIHGGPAGADLDMWSERWSTYPNILAQRGAFVLKPNYHGSSNHGLKFVESIKGHYYDLELQDILKGIAVLDKKGLIDKTQMGSMGWSNGAILTIMLTVRYPDMFKVAASGAGDVNWTSDFGTCRFGVSFDQSYFGGAPWDDKNGTFYNKNYIEKSPLFELDKVKTPSIIFHGSEDRAVPRDQGWEYYRALQQINKAPVRFLWFPGQPHGLQKITHQLRKMNEELKWIDKYLFAKKDTTNEAFKKDSPLASLLKLQKATQINGLYGLGFKGKLIPETQSVKKDSISIGVFEVTNAQFKAYKSGYTYLQSKGNYPVKVSRAEAKSYLSWLSDLTGRSYRLPNEKEAKSLHKKALKSAAKENTLNYWAGYAITLDELADFKQKLTDLKKTLIKPVGQFKLTKVGKATVYDLGGNLAEYYSKGIYGFSAYDFVDSKNKAMIKSRYVGFRVVEE
jgi:dipeptidyl aminopeptidase/acylaminoacyl peptidase